MDLMPVFHKHTQKIIEQFIKDRFKSSGVERVTLGISGGLDSSVVLKLASNVLGPERVSGFYLPYGAADKKDKTYAEMAAVSAGIELKEEDISPMIEPIPFKMEDMVLGNAQARVRMIVLYTYANKENALVIGTSNKTELMIGYFTKYGDGAADLYPIGDLFKTQVISLAENIKIPEEIIHRAPSPGLLEGQTDEGEIGLPYPLIDQILVGYLHHMPAGEILDGIDHTCVDVDQMDRAGFSPPVTENDVSSMIRRIRSSRHKRWPLQVPKIGGSTPGIDLRERW